MRGDWCGRHQWERTVKKPNSVIVHGYSKYLFGAVDSTDRMNSSYISCKTRQVAVDVETHYNIASKRAFPTGVLDR